MVFALERSGQIETLPSRNTILQADDKLLVQGRIDRFNRLRRWSELVIERESSVLQDMIAARTRMAEVTIVSDSPLIRQTVGAVEFRRRFGVEVRAVRRKNKTQRRNLARMPLRADDRLLVQGRPEAIDDLLGYSEFSSDTGVTDEELRDDYELHDHTFVTRVPHGSGLGGTTLAESGLTSAFDFRVLTMFRDGELHVMPEPTDMIQEGQLLLLQGRAEDLHDLRALQELVIEDTQSPNLNVFEADRLATVEVALAPRSGFVGQSVAAINFRERSGLELSAIWRSGALIHDDLPPLLGLHQDWRAANADRVCRRHVTTAGVLAVAAGRIGKGIHCGMQALL